MIRTTKIGSNKGNPRVWLEGQILTEAFDDAGL